MVRTVESRAAIILKELIKGPVDPKLQPILSPRTKIYSVLIVGDTVYVNFSIEFSADLPRREIDEVLAVYSVVNSLTEIDNINNVQVLIEGERSYAFLNHFSLREPLVRNEKLTKETIDLPIDVLRLYFKHLENQEIRQAFNLIYCPKEFELGYSTFFMKL
ncbi:MAG: GerMN domain-containing protein [Clostridiales bacterium]|nr:GerMN domain-containing protein [Clostridiales bacterium]